MTRSIRISGAPAIEYPESDGKPVADNTLPFKWIVVIKEGLEARFQDDANVFVAGDLLWYPVERQPLISAAPDAMVVFSRPKGYRGSYKQWLEDNIPPQAVFEVLSPNNRPPEMRLKFQFYEKYGVEEYYLYDPDSGDFKGWLRRGGRLARIPRMKEFVSPRLAIRFEPGNGADDLQIIDARGQPFLTYSEITKRLEAERQRADAEHQRAERLAARLKTLGEDTD
jgi:Uma2 family endonuclease